MAEVLLFHHAQGLTDGVVAFAGELRSAGCTVHTPDLYDGNTFASLDDGMAYADELTFDTVIGRGHEAAEGLGEDLVYVGFSLGRELAGSVAGAELFLYPGDRHLFTDASLPDHDPDAAALVRDRVRSFLGALGQRRSRGSSIAGSRP